MLLHFCGSPDPFFMQRNEPCLPYDLHPREGDPVKHRLILRPRNAFKDSVFKASKLAPTKTLSWCVKIKGVMFSILIVEVRLIVPLQPL